MLSSKLFTCNLLFLSPYPSVFLCLFCLKSLRSIPFPHLRCSLKHTITSPAQTPNALPLHPKMPPMPTGRHKPLLSCRCPHTRALGLRICQEGPGQVVPSSEPLMWVPRLLQMGHTRLGGSWERPNWVLFGLPLPPVSPRAPLQVGRGVLLYIPSVGRVPVTRNRV